MRVLKGIVAFMGLLIITLMILIVYGMIQKSQNPEFSFFSGDDKPSPSSVQSSTRINLGEGASVVDTTIGDGRLVISVDNDGDGNADTLVILDLESGRELGRVKVEP